MMERRKIYIIFFSILLPVFTKGIPLYGDVLDLGSFLTSSAKEEFIKVFNKYDSDFKKFANEFGQEFSTGILISMASSTPLSGDVLPSIPHLQFGTEISANFLNSKKIFSTIDQEPFVDYLPAPYTGGFFGIGFFDKIDLRVKYFAMPKITKYLPEGASLYMSYIAIESRYKIFDSSFPLPGLTLGLLGGYAGGKIGYTTTKDGSISYDEDYFTANGTYEATFTFSTTWKLITVDASAKFYWNIFYIFKPFIGFGVSINGGYMDFKESIEGSYTVEVEYKATGDTVSNSDNVTIESQVSPKPISLVNHWSIGLEVNLWFVKIGTAMDINMRNRTGTVAFGIYFGF